MSQVKVSGNASGTGVFEIAAPNSNTSYTLTLPQATTTLVGTDATQTLTNKTLTSPSLTSPTISGAVMSSMASSVLTSGVAVSASGTSVDFTGIPTWVKRVAVSFFGISATSSDEFLIQIGNGSFLTSGYTSTSSGSSTSAAATNGFLLTVSSAAGSAYYGTVYLDSMGSNWTSSGNLSGGSNTVRSSAGAVSLGALDRVRITSLTGAQSFDAGTFNIKYE